MNLPMAYGLIRKMGRQGMNLFFIIQTQGFVDRAEAGNWIGNTCGFGILLRHLRNPSVDETIAGVDPGGFVFFIHDREAEGKGCSVSGPIHRNDSSA